ncbi:MAG: hypothetical protein Q8934_12925 [Bacillota bacterium]|nr:hypothetical protein [Bacillota bacterium]
MLYMYGKDYIRYLNDEKAGRLTYDQWKDKKMKHESTMGNEKTNNQHYSK